MRTLPLTPAFKGKLLRLQEEQKEHRRICGRSYDKRYLDYRSKIFSAEAMVNGLQGALSAIQKKGIGSHTEKPYENR